MTCKMTEASAVQFRQNFGDMLNSLYDRCDSIATNKDSKTIAALIDALSQRSVQGFVQTPESIGMEEINAAVAELRCVLEPEKN